MRILSARVRNFRGHDDLFVEFDRMRTVVAGPNESGKSTLVEAIDRALFHPYKSSAGLTRLKPRASGANPEVIIEFERGGQKYSLRKLFKGPQSVATLAVENGKEYQGEDADAQLRQLLGLGDRAANRPLFGWSHLWVRQGDAGDDPLSPDSLGEVPRALDRRLQGIAGSALMESPRDGVASDRIAKEHEDLFTTKGVRTGSSLHTAEERLQEARDKAATAAVQLIAFEDAADTVLREQAHINGHSQTLADAERALAETQPKIARIDQLEKDLANERALANAAEREYDALVEGDAQIVELGEALASHETALEPKESRIRQLDDRQRVLHSNVTRAAAMINDIVRAHEAAMTQAGLLAKVQKLFQLREEQTALAHTQKQINDLECNITAIDGRLRDLPVVDRTTLDAIEVMDRDLEVRKGKLRAIATRIKVLKASEPVAVDGVPLAAGDARTLTEASELRVGDGTAVLITPGDSGALGSLRIEVGELEAKLGTQLKLLGVADVGKAREAFQMRTSELADRKRHEERIEDLGGDATAKHLGALIERVTDLASEITRISADDFVLPTDAAVLAAAISESDRTWRDAGRRLEDAKTAFNDANEAAHAARKAWQDADAEVRGLRETMSGLVVKKELLEKTHGIDRESMLAKRADTKRTTAAAVKETERVLKELDAVATRDDLERYKRAVIQANADIAAARERRAAAQGRLHDAGMSDLHGVKAAADARVEVAERHYAEVKRRADAIRLLQKLFQTRRQQLADFLAEPLCRKVSEYLDAIFGTGCRVSFGRKDADFTDFTVTRPAVGGMRLEFEDLSGGTREQVAAACRLAMAELLAGGGTGEAGGDKPCLPMIFDDAFANSDPQRIKAVHRVLELGAKRGLQIIVLSCNPQEFGLFAGKRVDLEPLRPGGPLAGNPPVLAGDNTRVAGDSDGNTDASDDPLASEQAQDYSVGSVPVGDDAFLADTLLQQLQSLPAARAGNKRLRELLGWDIGTYERIKDRLAAEGRLKKGRGKGGSVYLDGGDDEV